MTDSNTTTPPPITTPKTNTAEATLSAAFPDIDAIVIRAVLTASSGDIERAFDALLGMSDPNFKPELPPQQPIIPPDTQAENYQQIEADELYARQLASGSTRSRPRTTADPEYRAQSNDHERSFIDDDLPVIKENIIQSFNETKVKVNSFLTNLRTQYAPRSDATPEQSHTATPPRTSDLDRAGRHSTQYDADPDAVVVLEDEFDQLQMEDHTVKQVAKTAPPTSNTKSKWQPLKDSGTKAPSSGDFALGDDDV